jgi:hypothetical protein
MNMETGTEAAQFPEKILKESVGNRKFLTVPDTFTRESVEERNYHHQSMTDTERI